jgi:hypothetical protein
VIDFFMALLPFEDSTPRAYRLKGSNAYLTFSTSIGTSPAKASKPAARSVVGQIMPPEAEHRSLVTVTTRESPLARLYLATTGNTELHEYSATEVTLLSPIIVTIWLGLFTLGVLFLVGFLYSWDYAGYIISAIFETKVINWLIALNVVLILVFRLIVVGRKNAYLYMHERAQAAKQAREAPRAPRKMGGVYGSASSADDYELDEAMRGNTGGLDPMFEE